MSATVKIVVGGKEIELFVNEAKELFEELKGLFEKQEAVPYCPLPHYPPYYPAPYVPIPSYPWTSPWVTPELRWISWKYETTDTIHINSCSATDSTVCLPTGMLQESSVINVKGY